MIVDRREFTVHRPIDVVAMGVQHLHQPRQVVLTTRGVRRDVKIEVTDYGNTDFVIRRLPVRPLAMFNRGRVEGKLQRLSSTHTLVTLNIDHRLTAIRTAMNFAACVLIGLIWGWLFALPLLVGISVLVGGAFAAAWYLYHSARLTSDLESVFGSAIRNAELEHSPFGNIQPLG